MADVAAPAGLIHPCVPLLDLEAVDGRRHGPPLPLQLPLPHPQPQLVGLGRVVADHEIPVGIGAGGPGAEGLGAVSVGEDIMGVAVALRHREVGVQGHPENEVGELAEAAAHIAADTPQEEHHAGEVAAPRAGLPDEPPVAEGLAGAEEDAVQLCRRQTEVHHLVALELHVLAPELAEQGCFVAGLKVGEGVLPPLLCPAVPGGAPEGVAPGGVVRLAQPEAEPAPLDGRAERTVLGIYHGMTSFAGKFGSYSQFTGSLRKIPHKTETKGDKTETGG